MTASTQMPDGGECRKVDPELFFPEANNNPTKANAVCARCPVLDRCRTWALANPAMTEHGVWGGMTRLERDRARRQLAKLARQRRQEQKSA